MEGGLRDFSAKKKSGKRNTHKNKKRMLTRRIDMIRFPPKAVTRAATRHETDKNDVKSYCQCKKVD